MGRAGSEQRLACLKPSHRGRLLLRSSITREVLHVPGCCVPPGPGSRSMEGQPPGQPHRAPGTLPWEAPKGESWRQKRGRGQSLFPRKQSLLRLSWDLRAGVELQGQGLVCRQTCGWELCSWEHQVG